MAKTLLSMQDLRRPNKMIAGNRPKKQWLNHRQADCVSFCLPYQALGKSSDLEFYRLCFFGCQRIGIDPARRRVWNSRLVPMVPIVAVPPLNTRL